MRPPIHVRGRVARIHPPDVRAQRNGIAERIHFLVVEVVVSLHVRPSAGSSLSGAKTRGAPLRQRPMSFAATSSCSSGVLPCCRRKSRKRADMLVKSPIGHETAVAGKHFRMRQLEAGSRSSSGYPRINSPGL